MPPRMATVTACDVPEGSLLAEFGGPADYRDCFIRDVPGDVSLADFIERFYCSMAFLPERLVLRAIAGPSSRSDARAVARGEALCFGAWKVVERREFEALLDSQATGTACWFRVEALPTDSAAVGQTGTPSRSAVVGRKTRLYFGSWVGNVEQTGWNSMLGPHVWYSRLLLGAV